MFLIISILPKSVVLCNVDMMAKTLRKKSFKPDSKKIFVAGGTGFLGKHLVKRLAKENIPYVSSSLSRGVDFRDIKQLEKFFKKEKPDVVINAATFVGGIQFGYEKPGEIFFNNTLISTNLIECSRRASVSLFINILPNCTYPGASDKPVKESEWWNGPIHESVLSYGMSRKASWVNSLAYHKQYGMKFVNLILANMYGPGDHIDEIKSHALGALVKKIITAKKNKAKNVVVWGSGKPIREWLYVEDGVEAIVKALSINPTIEPINVCPGTGISIKDLAFLIKKAAGYNGKLVFDKKYPDGAPYKVMDATLCKKVFGWVPSTDFKYGLQKTIEYFEQKIH